MNENKKVELINTVFSALVIFGCFFAGYMMLAEPVLSAVLLACCILLSAVRAIPTEEE